MMRLSHLASLCMALSAQAALVLPELSPQDLKFWTGAAAAAAAPAASSEEKASVFLHCESCPVAVGNSANGQPLKWIDNTPIDLLLEVVQRDRQIFLNEVPIYPPSPAALGRPVSGKQIAPPNQEWTESEPLFAGSVSLSVSVQMHHELSAETTRTGERVTSQQLSIDVIGVNGQVVRLDSVELRFDSRSLRLLEVGTSPSLPSNDQCTTVLCRFSSLVHQKLVAAKALAASQLQRLKSACKGKHHAHKSSPLAKVKGGVSKFGGKFDEEGHFRGFREGSVHHHGGHHHAHHRGRCNRLAHAAIRAIRTFVLPLMLGLASGMALGAVCMVVGQIAMFAYNRLRYGPQGYQPVRVLVLEEDGEEAGEKDAMLPRYEDAVGNVSVVMVDEKN